MQQEALFARAFEAVDVLLVVAGAERRDHEGLRLAAREQRRAVRARQHVHFGQDRADGLEVAAVDAVAGADDVAAHHVLLEQLEHRAHLDLERGIGAFRHQGVHRLLLGGVDLGVAGLLFLGREGFAQIGLDRAAHRGLLGRVVRRLEVPGVLGGAFGELDDRVDDRLEALLAERDGVEHRSLRTVPWLRFRPS